MSIHTFLPSVIYSGDADVPFVSSVKNLGVTLDSNLSMSQHKKNTCKTAYIQIRHRRSIRHTYKSGTPLLYGIHTNQAHQFYTVYIQIRHISSIRYTYKSGTSVLYGIFLPLQQLKPLLALLFSPV